MKEEAFAILSALLPVALVLSACAAPPSPDPSPAPDLRFGDLELDTLELPTEYQRLTADESGFEQRNAEWSLAIVGEQSTNTCGDELQWAWLDNTSAGSRVGDPSVRLFICTTASVNDAAAAIDSVPIEETVVPRLDGIYEARHIPTNELELDADAAAVACVWGEPSECRAWAYIARYDRYVVNASFVLAGIGGSLGQEAFVDLIQSIDSMVMRSMDSS